MRPLGVNRVVIAVRHLEKGIELYSRLLGATFHDQSVLAEPLGLRCAISWDAGIELIAPLPGRDSYATAFMDKHGEGLMGVLFAVDDVDQARDTAEEMGIGVLALIADYDQGQIDEYLQGRFKKYKEYMLDPADTHGVLAGIGQIEPK